ncbi:hypothetical protein COT48_04125 [Candidatus Woesearchaeota archaeon CG08_land_8_20_14_0_20_47_9]|nr:MAG: hypothetical protein COT48_04125 [Candidatus Woesearchaeota archaeon CG08_land_8_20_14_0_20_47_9]
MECIEYTVNGKLWTIKSYTKKGITHLTAFLTTGHIGSIQLMSAQEFMQLEKSKPHPQYVKEQEEHRNSLTLYKRLFPIVGLLINGPH